jgi:protocatechuate 3,4-dioxygenase beta subunit
MSKTNDLTNSDGSFAMRFQPASKQVYLLAQDIEKNLYALSEVTEDQKKYTLQLQKGLIVKGKVTDRQGQPIAGALVEQRCDIPHTITLLGEKVLSDKKGEYTFRAVPLTQGPITYTFQAFADGFGGGEIRNLKMEGPQEEYVVPDLKLLAASCTVKGIVVDEKGNPIPDLPILFSGCLPQPRSDSGGVGPRGSGNALCLRRGPESPGHFSQEFGSSGASHDGWQAAAAPRA